jgi:protoporphyrin/coproporphyrin ferrochelatase
MNRAVLLLAHGTPDTLDEIPAYLHNVTSGRPLPPAIIDEITHRYSLIGRSALTDITIEQARLLQQRIGVPVYVGMRNWKPYIATVVHQMREDGISAVAAICLAPQNSRTSVGLYRRAVFAESGPNVTVDFTDQWADHPLLIQAFAEHLRARRQELAAELGHPVPVLFTAHSVPLRTVQGDGANPPDAYAEQARRTASLVAAQLVPDGLRPSDWSFAFQSQGASGGQWIGPTVEETLTELRSAGRTAVIIQPIGFLCDHVEILYDIDIAFREYGARISLRVERTESLNDSPLLTAALADLAERAIARLSAQATTAAALP